MSGRPAVNQKKAHYAVLAERNGVYDSRCYAGRICLHHAASALNVVECEIEEAAVVASAITNRHFVVPSDDG
ncbi:MAG TPA: hypothetical protein VJ719_07320 [Chthoniobacterales bacterium]|nr:hypothetical protein [Chthoniobacterales bacterium]